MPSEWTKICVIEELTSSFSKTGLMRRCRRAPMTSPNKDNNTVVCGTANEFQEVAERILQNVNSVFDKDDLMDEFDIIPSESQSNRSPVLHTDHKLALESWCVPFLYSHSFKHFLVVRGGKNGPLLSCENGCDKEDIYTKIPISYATLSEADRIKRAVQLSRMLILLNPDLTLAWNFRREIFQKGDLSLKEELQLTSLTATRKPKCSECFSYRRWLVQKVQTPGFMSFNEQWSQFFQTEVNAADKAAIKYFSNYHAWNYRLFILETCLACPHLSRDEIRSFLEMEKYAADKWLKAHVSDYSGLCYRQKLLAHLSSTKKDWEVIYLDELTENKAMILFYPGHEALWCHRRAVVLTLTKRIQNPETNDYNEDKTFYKSIVENEYGLVREISKGDEKELKESGSIVDLKASNVKSNDNASLNVLYSQRYLKWLNSYFDKENLIC